MQEGQLYVHIPFCVKKCAYCDFLSFAEIPAAVKASYLQALQREIRAVGAMTPMRLRSVFFGGGTPSCLEPEAIPALMDCIREAFELEKDAECTLEANPGTITEEKARAWKQCGINRISMGVQSLDDRLLRRLGRIHTAAQAREQFQMLRELGFDNLSMDLMMGLPDQSLEAWQATLTEAVAMGPEHLSCYSLIVEEGTPFYKQQEEGLLLLPDEDTERAMYHWTVAYLAERGYQQYEISNFARSGRASRHNIGYWDRVPYCGVGLGAASLIASPTATLIASLTREGEGQLRYKNTEDLLDYLQHSACPEQIRQEQQLLTQAECKEEFMFLGLRKTEGVSGQAFRKQFGLTLEEQYGATLQTLMQEGLLLHQDDRYYLSPLGMDFGNQVFGAFLEVEEK